MTDTDRKHDEYYENEIELMDLFLVLWKNKVLIISGTLVCMVFAAIISWSMPEIYQFQMKIRPGYAELESKYQIERLKYVKDKIDAHMNDEKIIKEFSVPGARQIPAKINFKMSVPKNSDIIDIVLNVSDIELGEKIMQSLYSFISQDDAVMLGSIIDEYDNKIRLEEINLDKNKALEKFNLSALKLIDQKIESLDNMLADVKANNETLMVKQKKILDLSEKNAGGSFAALLCTITVQQNLHMINNIMMEIGWNLDRKQNNTNERILLKITRQEIDEAILENENLKNQVSKMVMLMPPKVSEHPVKPKKKMIVILAGIAGLFLMILTAFLLEYVSKFKEKQKLSKL